MGLFSSIQQLFRDLLFNKGPVTNSQDIAVWMPEFVEDVYISASRLEQEAKWLNRAAMLLEMANKKMKSG